MRLVILYAALLVGAKEPEKLPFDSYPVAQTRFVKAATPRLADPLSRRYRSALRVAALGKPNFAGHYIVSQIGCGAGCIRLAVIDRVSGRITWFPSTISGWPLEVTEPLAFRRDSRLMVVQGMLNEQEPTTMRQYVFDGSRFSLLAGK